MWTLNGAESHPLQKWTWNPLSTLYCICKCCNYNINGRLCQICTHFIHDMSLIVPKAYVCIRAALLCICKVPQAIWWQLNSGMRTERIRSIPRYFQNKLEDIFNSFYGDSYFDSHIFFFVIACWQWHAQILKGQKRVRAEGSEGKDTHSMRMSPMKTHTKSPTNKLVFPSSEPKQANHRIVFQHFWTDTTLPRW